MADTGACALEADDIHKSFGTHEVLKGVSLKAHKGDVISIIGSSGSGKSTFLRCINFLETPDRGRVIVNGEEIAMKIGRDGKAVPKSWRQVEKLRTGLGMVFQNFNLWAHRTVLENVIEAPVHVLGVKRQEAVEKAEALLNKVGLYDKKNAYPAFLSGGQQQRAAIARALCVEPHGDAVRRTHLGARSGTCGRGAEGHPRSGRGRPHHAARYSRDALCARCFHRGDVSASGPGGGSGATGAGVRQSRKRPLQGIYGRAGVMAVSLRRLF